MSNEPAAFAAAFSDWKLIRTRSCVQLVFEVPLSSADAAYAALGGMPDPATERWFAIARLRKEAPTQGTQEATAQPRPVTDKPPVGAKRQFSDLPPAQQAGIVRAEPAFAKYLAEKVPAYWRECGDDAAECVRMYCGVASCSELGRNVQATAHWNELLLGYRLWMREPAVLG